MFKPCLSVALLAMAVPAVGMVQGLLAGRGDPKFVGGAALNLAVVLLLGLLLLGGCIYPLRLLPAWLRAASVLSPARWAFSALYDTFAGQPVPWTLLWPPLLLAVPAGVAAWLSWRRARWDL